MAPSNKASIPEVVTTLDTTKYTIFKYDPAMVLLAGLDYGDSSTPGYDPRNNLPADDKFLRLVASIRKDGVLRPVIARKDGERIVKIDGGRRILAARAANLQLQAENPGVSKDDLIKIPVVIVRADELGMLNIRNIANSFAVKDDPYSEALAMQKMLDKGASEESLSLSFDYPVVTIRDRLKLLDLAPEAVEALKAKEITGNAALELTGITMGEQVKVLQSAREEAFKVAGVKPAKLATAAVTAAAQAARRGTPGAATTAVRKTPKEKITEAYALIHALMVQVATAPEPMDKTGRTARMPDMEAVAPVLRKLARLLDEKGKTYDAQVKALIPTVEAD